MVLKLSLTERVAIKNTIAIKPANTNEPVL